MNLPDHWQSTRPLFIWKNCPRTAECCSEQCREMEAQASVLGSCHPHSFALLFLAKQTCGKRHKASWETKRKWKCRMRGKLKIVCLALEIQLQKSPESESSLHGCRMVAVTARVWDVSEKAPVLKAWIPG